MATHSNVYLREEKKNVRVSNGLNNPEIPPAVRKKWQKLIDLLSKIFAVPASLIMQITDTDMQVFLSSQSADNPYVEGTEDSLGHGLYCETIIGRNAMLEIHDSLESPDWKDNPDVKLDMISYLGFPLRWPDGAVFGTISSLDSKKREYSHSFTELMKTFQEIVEMDLKWGS